MAKTALKTRIRNAKPGPGAKDKDAAPATAARPKPRRRLQDDWRLTWLVSENLMTPGKLNYDRFAKRMGCATVGEALAAGSTIGDLLYDSDHGYLRIENWDVAPTRAKAPAEAE